ncbi:hypothetical protein [Saccharopolyspora sp. ASAGF58]|uniref:hypothetical protein n=1 Tax=Saccharopolyspora sp. ASAGF58 TaxID=2719023 RepID=UPI00143FBECB|nr:hypothetical protein [Saccharopolyspora sp. ASAGF58]QIZ36614.1 hypothetical protein FDZ84_20575 [Saccharopolyspora sp. ASAGF58]
MTDTMSIPKEQDFLDQFGEAPEVLDEPWIQRTQIESENGTLELSYDAIQRSVQFVWRQADDVLWYFVRECATALSIRAENQETHLVAEFESEELSGAVDVKVYPRISIKDSSLRS